MKDLKKIVSLCKRRGFVYQNSEIYGGVKGIYDFGPLGVEMALNLKKLWWEEIVLRRSNVVGIDGSIITHPRVWEASGHIESFTDPLVECRKCHKRFCLDEIKGRSCPECGGSLSKPRKFNTLVETKLGVLEEEKQTYYLRGEACQNIYLNYDNVLHSTSQKIPFGIAQIGKAFRNEITPKSFLYRQREFEQWDLQFFVNPKEMAHWYEYWKKERFNWYKKLVNKPKNIRLRKHRPDELAHYAKVAHDIEYKTPFAGWKEWEGIHWRGDWDLSRHGQYSGRDFTYTDQKSGEKFIPHIVETSGGVDRTFLYLLLDAYQEESVQGQKRVVLRLNKKIAPTKVAVFPLLANKADLIKEAKRVFVDLSPHFPVVWDDNDNIGKRYRRQDEIGTPWCVTIDFDTLKDNTVTIRDRDTMKQKRIKIKDLLKLFKEELGYDKN